MPLMSCLNKISQKITNHKQDPFGALCYRVLIIFILFVGVRIYWLNFYLMQPLMKQFSNTFMQPKGLQSARKVVETVPTYRIVK